MRRASFAMVVIGLVACAAMVGGVLYWSLKAAATAETEVRNYLTRIAALATAVLILSVVILFAVIVRYVALRLSSPEGPRAPDAYEDAWTEAGRRLKAEDAPPVEGFEGDEDDGPRG